MTSGFLRSSNRTLSSASTVLDPVPTYLTADRRTLPSGRFTLVRDARGPHRAHFPGRHPTAHRHFRSRRGPPLVGLRHAGHPRPRGRHRGARRRAGLVARAQRGAAGGSRPPPCRPAARCAANRAGPTPPSAISTQELSNRQRAQHRAGRVVRTKAIRSDRSYPGRCRPAPARVAPSSGWRRWAIVPRCSARPRPWPAPPAR